MRSRRGAFIAAGVALVATAGFVIWVHNPVDKVDYFCVNCDASRHCTQIKSIVVGSEIRPGTYTSWFPGACKHDWLLLNTDQGGHC